MRLLGAGRSRPAGQRDCGGRGLTAATSTPEPRFERLPDDGWAGGVLVALARRFGVAAGAIRAGFLVLIPFTGGLVTIAYAIAWATLPASSSSATRSAGGSRTAGLRVSLGAGLLALSVLLAFRQLGIWWSDALVWPLVLAAAGAALLWRTTRRVPRPGSPAPAATEPQVALETGRRRRAAAVDLYRGGFGIALVLGAALLFLSANDALGAVRDAALTGAVVVLALALILAPFIWRLGRNLADERAARIRSQERAELAAHLHDSVLQTLNIVQRRAGDPEVGRIARRQERELRAWLDGDSRAGEGHLGAGLRRIAHQVEDDHGVEVELVEVGDAPLEERSEALLAATSEAVVNAAKFAGSGGAIRVYAEVDATAIRVFVRDRGPGFDLDAIPDDRRGVRESILGRMQRHGGSARIRRLAGGTEVELEMPR